jgi:hypothetical protein
MGDRRKRERRAEIRGGRRRVSHLNGGRRCYDGDPVIRPRERRRENARGGTYTDRRAKDWDPTPRNYGDRRSWTSPGRRLSIRNHVRDAFPADRWRPRNDRRRWMFPTFRARTRFVLDGQQPTPRDIVDHLLDPGVEVWGQLASWTDLPAARITGFRHRPVEDYDVPCAWTKYPEAFLIYEAPGGGGGVAPFEWWGGFEIRRKERNR